MELRLDLHIHSERSFDGCMSLSEIVALARELGLNGVAICDHDRVLDEVPEFDDFLVIPATEVSTERGNVLKSIILQRDCITIIIFVRGIVC